MNVVEGAARMKRAGRWTVIIALSGFMLALCLLVTFTFTPLHLGTFELLQLIAPVMMLGTVATVLGAGLWLAGWITEGFGNSAH